jgi:putative oxidoreductase
MEKFGGGWQLTEQAQGSQDPQLHAQEFLRRNGRPSDLSYTRNVWQIMSAGGTNPSWGLAVLRLVAGAVFVASGSQKLFHLGFAGVAAMFASMQIPVPFVSAVVVTLLEFLGGIALVLGVFTRSVAALLAMDMLVAVLTVYFEPAFFKGGIQFPLTLMAAGITLALSGPGALSLGSVISNRTRGC